MGGQPWSDWATGAFGEHVDELRARVPAALAEAHRRARAAHDAGQASDQRVYGNALWVFQHEELVRAIRSVDGAQVVRLGAYELPVVAGKALFPLRYTEQVGVPVERARLTPLSPQRERLFAAHAAAVAHAQPLLDESWADLQPPDAHEPFPQLGDDVEMITIAYACNIEAGVLYVAWGYAEHVGDGELRWGPHSELPLMPAQAAAVHPVGHPGNGRFDTGEHPGLDLGLRHPGAREANVPPQTERHPNQARVRNHDQE